jgi:DNA modification methylase
MTLGSASVIRGNARHLPLADNSVDLVVTSPPYFALRSYQDGGEHYAGQIGDEPTPAEFVASLLEVTRECVRVLKPSGSLWVNLGDKYAQPGKGERNRNGLGSADLPEIGAGFLRSAVGQSYGGVRGKSLIGIPWRYALACIDDLGLILRAEVIWSKPNGLPESVTDRVRRSHEQWFHFTREPRYFSAVDEIREAHKPGQSPSALSFNRSGRETAPGQTMAPHRVGRDDQGLNPLGKLPGSVWTVPTEPLRVPDHLGIDHFAAFPTEWPKRIIQGWSPQGVCVECGEGRRPQVVTDLGIKERNTPAYGAGNHGTGGSTLGSRGPTATITGYSCACPEPTADTRPSVVLDPFGGTGTVAMVAKALGRHGITVDMSADYCRLAEWRTNDRNQLAKVLGIAKTTTPPDVDQLDLFTEETA